ncbi:PilN domain-containing protein [Lysobacter sp. F60174L2]|uniref:PilN domain-containing protein n=1 Tax=Lysobacter sp. F60174L2 TaxID=3459295 RepID=UPI00403DAF40
MSLFGSSLGGRLGHIGARLGPGAGGFLRWWGGALASWLPLRWRRVLGFDRGRLLLQRDGDELQLRLNSAGELRDLGRLPLLPPLPEGAPTTDDPLARLLDARIADLPRWLLLAPAQGLRRRISLPAAAADRLRDVVGFEIDRQTPFTADAVAYDARVLGRRDGDGQVDAELVAVPRAVLDPQLAALGPLTPTLAGVDLAAADGLPLGINLLPPSQRRRHRDPWAGWNLALAAVAVVAIAALLWQLLDNRRDAAEAFEQEIARSADAGRQAAAQRGELMELIEGQAFLDRARAQRPTSIEVIDELTRRLPDGTYLEKLSIDDQQMLLIGLSGEAAALIGQLQGTGLWQSPALAGALQPDPDSGRDRFTLVAKLAKPTPAATKPPEAGDDATDPAG